MTGRHDGYHRMFDGPKRIDMYSKKRGKRGVESRECAIWAAPGAILEMAKVQFGTRIKWEIAIKDDLDRILFGSHGIQEEISRGKSATGRNSKASVQKVNKGWAWRDETVQKLKTNDGLARHMEARSLLEEVARYDAVSQNACGAAPNAFRGEYEK